MKKSGISKGSHRKLTAIQAHWKQCSRKKKGIAIGSAVVLAAGIITAVVFFQRHLAQPVMAGSEGNIEVTAATGTIANTIIGTGNLANDDAVSIKIPSGVVIDEVLVESGDEVLAGDVLATVDSASVYSAMEEVQSAIDELDAKINDCREDSSASSVTSKVDGRIKKIYAGADASISQVMLEQGALMLISLDGKLAVEFQTSGTVAVDDSVIVQRSSGAQVTGTVESISGNTVVVTMTDSGIGMEESVSVFNLDGTSLGSGTTYIHEQMALTGTTGTISSVSVVEDEAISSGTTLYTVVNDGTSTEYKQLTASRQAYADTLQKLLELAQTGAVTADRDGTIGSVLVSEGNSSSSGSSGSSGTSGSGASASGVITTGTTKGKSTGVVLTSKTDVDVTAVSEPSETDSSSESSSEDSIAASGNELQFTITSGTIGSAQAVMLQQPVTGAAPQTEITTADGSYTGIVTWNPGAKTFAAATSYQAMVTLSAAEGYLFTADSVQHLASGILSGITVSADQKTMSFTITFPETGAATNADTNTGNNSNANGSNTNNSNAESSNANSSNTNSNNTGSNTAGGSAAGGNTVNNNTAAAQSTVGSTSGASGGNSTAGSGETTAAASTSDTSDSSSASSTSSEYSTDTAAFTISGNAQMILAVNVDELDINSISVGQEAEVTFDALEDETFTGTVTKIGNTATVSGGVAKYTVNITIDKTEAMKAGMNASATIVIEQKENVVTIPVNALQERGSKVYVYTEEDSDGNLSGEQTVTTGLSDGDTVEITDGLSEGDTVYYQKTGNLGSSSETTGKMGENRGNMGNMNDGNMSGGSAPGGSGGNMGGGTPPGM
ncbi:MAG: HlyD family efflux transporter periplasmic adaptor subunit [Lachnospiraceae bacterium]|nr:HlyD family efflux transporter periplasmic adaptor subunit [Lachnospiraceae bacterium]